MGLNSKEEILRRRPSKYLSKIFLIILIFSFYFQTISIVFAVTQDFNCATGDANCSVVVSPIHSSWDSFTDKVGDIFKFIFGIKDKVVTPVVTTPTTASTTLRREGTTIPVVTPTSTIIQQISQAGLTGNTGPQGLRGFTGPQGPKGDKGESGVNIDSSSFVSKSFLTNQVDRIYDSTSNSIQGLSLSLGKEINTKLLTVSGDTTVGGNLTVTGNIIGNAVTVTNGVYTNVANLMTDIAPLTTLAESWIGPSSTTGIYFKDGNVGVGTTTPSQKLDVNGNITVHSNIYNTDYITKTPEKNNWIKTLPLASTWTDAGYSPISDPTDVKRQPQIIKQGDVYYVFHEYLSDPGNAGSWHIGIEYSSSLAGPWTFVSDIIPLSAHVGDPDYTYVADPSVLYIPWAEHKWQMWFDMSYGGYRSSTIGHAQADNPLGPWTKQQTGGVTDIVIGPDSSKFNDFIQETHAPECFINVGSVNCLYAVQGAGHTRYDTALAVANDSQGLGTSFEQWGPVTVDNSIVTGDAYRLQSPFAYQDVLYTTIENNIFDKYYWVSSADGGKSWTQLGEAAYPFHSFLAEGNKIWGITQSHGSPTFPMKFYYLDLENINGYAPMTDNVIGAKTNLPIISNVYSGYYVQGDTDLYRFTTSTWRTSSSLIVDGNVGIGKTSPTAKLSVLGADSLSTSFAANISGATGTGLVVTNNGNVGIGTAAPTSKLVLGADSGTANVKLAAIGFERSIYNPGQNAAEIQFWRDEGATEGILAFATQSSASSLTERMRISKDGFVGIGTTTPVSELQISSSSTNYFRGLTISQHNTGSSSPVLIFRKSRGTESSPLSVTSGDYIAGIQASGYGSTTYSNPASILLARTTEAWTDTANGFKISFITTNNGSTSGLERMVILANGNVGIGTAAPTANLQVAQGTAGVGTVSVVAGGTAWTGVGTQFLNTFKVGDSIISEGQTLTIATITSNTALTTNAVGDAISAKAYTLAGGTKFSVLGNGNVGIGTTNPLTTLQVSKANQAITGWVTGASSIGKSHLALMTSDTGGAADIGGVLGLGGTYNATGSEVLYGAITGRKQFAGTSNATGYLSFLTQNTGIGLQEWMRITGAGNVGIGTTAPTANLQVAQSTAGTGTVSNGAGGTTVTGVGTQFLNTFKIGDTITINGETVAISAIASNTSMTTAVITGANSGVEYTLVGGTRFLVLGNGNVGIGTVSPITPLHVNGTIRTNRIATTNQYAELNGGDVNGIYLNSYSAVGSQKALVISNLVTGGAATSINKIQFKVGADTSPVTAATIDYLGNIGIGIAVPTNILHVTGTPVTGTHTARIANTLGGITQNNGLLILAGNDSGVAVSELITFKRPDNTTIGTITQTGAGAIAFNSGSDRRIKDEESIKPTIYGLLDLLNIKVDDFTFISDPNKQKMTGFIAQELNTIYPGAVTTNGDNGTDALTPGATPWMIDYSKLTPLLVKSVQELDLKVEDLAISNTIVGYENKTFIERFFGGLINWFADSANGIGKIFVKEVNTDKVNTKEICINGTCVTEAELLYIRNTMDEAGISDSVSTNADKKIDNTENTDVCPNIDGVQTEIPAGDEINAEGQCVEITGGDTGGTDDSKKTSDTIAPTITLTGEKSITLKVGDTYSEAGATATDDVDASVTVDISGTVDTATAGTYTVTYSAKDVAGNSATEVTRTVTVE